MRARSRHQHLAGLGRYVPLGQGVLRARLVGKSSIVASAPEMWVKSAGRPDLQQQLGEVHPGQHAVGQGTQLLHQRRFGQRAGLLQPQPAADEPHRGVGSQPVQHPGVSALHRARELGQVSGGLQLLLLLQ
ncbi:hypothetical protein ABT120_46570 [Nonomuraea angiospora]|uniref:hypothetical protein n=1 Tax=Nonomuraea angiospora TaxID=46172 RepID=UPI003320A5DE